MDFRKLILAVSLLMATGCADQKQSSSLQPSVPAETPLMETTSPAIKGIRIGFQIERMPGEASNQTAIWVQDEDGQLVKTLYVSDFTGRKRGYRKRPDALNHWTAIADPDNISDTEMDLISGATFENGEHQLTWDLTDQKGNKVPAGIYTINLEGTLYWASNVVYSVEIDMNDPDEKISVQKERSEESNSKNSGMIQNVKVDKIYG